MQISGAAHLHGPQSINQPHRAGQAQPNSSAQRNSGVDRLDISHEAEAASRALETNGIRQDRVAEARQRIESGYYDNSEVLDAALGKLLDDLVG